MTARQADLDTRVSAAFRAAFLAHPARTTDSALALDSAREDACDLIPAGVTGNFDDETLTFTAEVRS